MSVPFLPLLTPLGFLAIDEGVQEPIEEVVVGLVLSTESLQPVPGLPLQSDARIRHGSTSSMVGLLRIRRMLIK